MVQIDAGKDRVLLAGKGLQAARSPSETISSSPRRALSSRAGSRLSQRRLAPALATIDISGWLISCAMDEVNCPTVVARETRVSSAWATRMASSALRWVVMSVMMP